MKKIIVILMCVISFSCFASDYSYGVTGEDENGNELEGTIYSNNGEQEVSGELTDENGDYIHKYKMENLFHQNNDKILLMNYILQRLHDGNNNLI